jgi:hypothetical protein
VQQGPPLQQVHWRWSCDRCGIAVSPPGGGAFRCHGCQRVLEVRWNQAGQWYVQGATAVPDATLPPTVDYRCPRHPGYPTVAACDRCGDFTCAPCSRLIQGRRYCATCFETLYQEGQLARRTSIVPYVILGAVLTVGSLYLMISWIVQTASGASSGTARPAPSPPGVRSTQPAPPVRPRPPRPAQRVLPKPDDDAVPPSTDR